MTSKFHVLLKWNQNNKIKFVVYQNKIYGFPLQNTYSYFYSPKIMSMNAFLFPKTFFFWEVPSHIIVIQNQQEFKFQTYNVPWSVPILNALFI